MKCKVLIIDKNNVTLILRVDLLYKIPTILLDDKPPVLNVIESETVM
jgi:hypothetical protein